MKNRIRAQAALVFSIFATTLLVPGTASAHRYVESQPLSRIVAAADVLAVVRIESVAPNGPSSPFDLAPAATYRFMEERTVKGTVEHTFTVALPALDSTHYGDPAWVPRPGDTLLVFLKRGTDTALAPVDAKFPIVPVDAGAMVSGEGNALKRVTGILVASLKTPALRQTAAWALRTVVDPSLPALLAPYVNEPELPSSAPGALPVSSRFVVNPWNRTQDALLSCLARNHRVSAIPLIAKLAEKEWKETGNGPWCLARLPDYTSKFAVPYLNPLLVSAAPGARVGAMIALRDIADSSSIPYLMAALDDPEESQQVAYDAYDTLVRLAPDAAAPQMFVETFYANREEAVKRFYAWWRAELSGSHNPRLLVPGNTSSTPASEPLPTNLFAASPTTRLATAKALATTKDPANRPALVLAMADPNKDVAYAAYSGFQAITGVPKTAVSRTTFALDQAAALKPIRTWWADEMMGRRLLPSPNGLR